MSDFFLRYIKKQIKQIWINYKIFYWLKTIFEKKAVWQPHSKLNLKQSCKVSQTTIIVMDMDSVHLNRTFYVQISKVHLKIKLHLLNLNKFSNYEELQTFDYHIYCTYSNHTNLVWDRDLLVDILLHLHFRI